MAEKTARAARKQWGDPRWTMRRMFVSAVCSFAGLAFLLAMRIDDPEKIRALGDLITALSIIVMPVIISYLGIAEAGSLMRDIKAPSSTRVTSTFEQVQKDPNPQQAQGEGA